MGNVVQVQQRPLQLFLIGDSAYPLLSWLIKPFPFSSSLSSEQKLFNHKISRARVVVVIAYGRLKAQWRRLTIFPTSLHNVCEVHKDNFDDEWLHKLITEMAQPNCGSTTSSTKVTGGEEVREISFDYISCIYSMSKGYMY